MSERLLVVGELPARFHSEACLSASLPTLGQNRSHRSDTPPPAWRVPSRKSSCERLGPAFGSVFPLSSAVRRGRGVHCNRSGQSRLVIVSSFVAFPQKRGGHPQRLNFFFQPRYLKLFLSQNLVNVPHANTFDIRQKFGAPCRAFGFYLKPSCHFLRLKNNSVPQCALNLDARSSGLAVFNIIP